MYWLVLNNQILSAFLLSSIFLLHWLSQHYSQCKLLPHFQWRWRIRVLPQSTELGNYVLSGKSPRCHINPHYCHKGHIHLLPRFCCCYLQTHPNPILGLAGSIRQLGLVLGKGQQGRGVLSQFPDPPLKGGFRKELPGWVVLAPVQASRVRVKTSGKCWSTQQKRTNRSEQWTYINHRNTGWFYNHYSGTPLRVQRGCRLDALSYRRNWIRTKINGFPDTNENRWSTGKNRKRLLFHFSYRIGHDSRRDGCWFNLVFVQMDSFLCHTSHFICDELYIHCSVLISTLFILRVLITLSKAMRSLANSSEIQARLSQ